MPAQRNKVLPQRVTGTIEDWKGKFGWIQADIQINHPQATKHQGKIYLGIQDVEEEITGVGAAVSFWVYEDGSGLGAMNCRPVESFIPARAPMPMSAPAAARSVPQHQQPSAPRQRKPFVQQAKESLDGDPMTGTVKMFKGHFGWINPDEKPDHPGYRGQLYVAGDDCTEKHRLTTGARVTFTLYKDGQGIGAENVVVDEDGEEGAEPPAPAKTFNRPGPPPGMKAPTPKATANRSAPYPGGAARGPVAAVGGKGGGKRQRLTELEITGETIEWANGAGLINPYDPIDHPAAKGGEAKVRVVAADIQGDHKELAEGQLVQFHVFVDNRGLGAEEVLPF